jgi:DMSO reductase anchor subunit
VNETNVTRAGLEHVRPGREATTGVHTGPGGGPSPSTARKRAHPTRGEQPMVPDAELHSYYGQPIINQPVWKGRDIAGYFFLGGLAGAASVMAAGAHLSGRRTLGRALKVGAAVAAALSTAALVHDLGRPARFVNMLRTFKPTSPMSVGSWVLASYAPAATVAAASDLTGIAPGLGTLATTGAAALGPVLATYTAALVSNTAVPAWHDGYREMPFVFASSAVTSAAGLGLVAAPLDECGPARLLAVLAAAAELGTERVMEERMGLAKEAFHQAKASTYQKAAEGLLGVGIVGAVAGRRSRLASALSGAALMAGSAFTRFAIFEAGLASAADPKYTVVPQRQRLEVRAGRPSAVATNGHAPAEAFGAPDTTP